jgi:tRNA-dihydrouridine synthase B
LIDSALDTGLAVGAVSIANRVVLAPMSGVTDIVFRRICVRLGAGLAVSEMVASAEFAAGNSETRLRAEGGGMPVHVIQLVGREARWMGEAARVAEAAGADIVDINMGCPAKKVTGGLSGSALLRDLDHAMTLVDAVVAACRVPVTLKMRLGWDEQSIVAPELARRAENAGVRAITVHGRTRQQFYTGQADWHAIQAVKRSVSVPVIANGDLTQPQHASAMLAASGADGVMIGRGAQGRPWFPGQVAAFLAAGSTPPDPGLDTQLQLALEHYEGLLDLYGEETGVRHARKHLGWYLDAASDHAGAAVAPELRARAMTARLPAEARTALAAAYDDLGWRAAA